MYFAELSSLIKEHFVVSFASRNKDVHHVKHSLVPFPQCFNGCLQIFFANQIIEHIKTYGNIINIFCNLLEITIEVKCCVCLFQLRHESVKIHIHRYTANIRFVRG